MGILIHHISNNAKWQHIHTSTKCAQNMHFFPTTKVTKEFTFYLFSNKIGHIHLLIKCIWIYSSAIWKFSWNALFSICFIFCWSKQNKISKLAHKSIKFHINEHFQISHWIWDNRNIVIRFFSCVHLQFVGEW